MWQKASYIFQPSILQSMSCYETFQRFGFHPSPKVLHYDSILGAGGIQEIPKNDEGRNRPWNFCYRNFTQLRKRETRPVWKKKHPFFSKNKARLLDFRGANLIHPWRLTWNIVMEVWRIISFSKWVICRFHVNLPGCNSNLPPVICQLSVPVLCRSFCHLANVPRPAWSTELSSVSGGGKKLKRESYLSYLYCKYHKIRYSINFIAYLCTYIINSIIYHRILSYTCRISNNTAEWTWLHLIKHVTNLDYIALHIHIWFGKNISSKISAGHICFKERRNHGRR